MSDLLLDYETVVEVGIGTRVDLSATLVDAGVSVVATDVVERSVPDGVTFVLDDLTDPDVAVYDGAGAIVGRNLPPELQGPMVSVATAVDADWLFTTLGTDPALVPADPLTVVDGTVFVPRRN
ncbi:MAG: UPF0146 family protein [Halodesulfurarchaeum sp.]